MEKTIFDLDMEMQESSTKDPVFVTKQVKLMKEKWAAERQRDEANAAAQRKTHDEWQQRQQGKLDAVLSTPQAKRNKAFWDTLKTNDFAAYAQLSAQRQEDQKALGFLFQLKG